VWYETGGGAIPAFVLVSFFFTATPASLYGDDKTPDDDRVIEMDGCVYSEELAEDQPWNQSPRGSPQPSMKNATCLSAGSVTAGMHVSHSVRPEAVADSEKGRRRIRECSV